MLKWGDVLGMWYSCAVLFLKPEHVEMAATLESNIDSSGHILMRLADISCVLSTSGVAVPTVAN